MQKFSSFILAALVLAHTSGAQNALDWQTISACAEDYGSRVIANDVTTQYKTDNTPNSCIERCDAAGYTYAGVEFSNECHCGSGLKSTPVAKPASECNMPCTGDPNLTCGGSLRIQIYKSPALSGGSYNYKGCYIDQTWMPALDDTAVRQKFSSSQDIVGQCTSYCQHAGYRFVGVKDASTCECSSGLREGALRTSDKDCKSLCNDEEWCVSLENLQVFEYHQG
ncbi:WSC domain-containing protein [Daedaleopsis nitida]|nr:WSC domain-containing protein [Daedaleopsis nitida]